MDITTILGILVGVIAVVGAMIFKHISFGVLLNPAAFFVIILGTVATILNSYPAKNLKTIGALFKILFTTSKGGQEVELIKRMMELSSKARKEGILSLEGDASNTDDLFLGKGLRLVVDGNSEEYIVDVLGCEIEAIEARHETNASIFSSAGTYAPTLGVLGAVFGLIAAMANINDTDAMAEAIAAAFIATILGIFTGYVLWHPFAKKLKVKSQEELLLKSMTIEGLISIQKGDSPLMVRDKLLSILPEKQQVKVIDQLTVE